MNDKTKDDDLTNIPRLDRERAIKEGTLDKTIEHFHALEQEELEEKQASWTMDIQLAESTFQIEQRFDPKQPHVLALRKEDIKYNGPKLVPQALDKLLEQLHQLLNQAYLAIAQTMGLTVKQENGQTQFLDKNNQPISLAARLKMEEQMPSVFNKLPNNKNFVMVNNGLAPGIRNMLEGKGQQPAQSPNQSPAQQATNKQGPRSPYALPDPFDMTLKRK